MGPASSSRSRLGWKLRQGQGPLPDGSRTGSEAVRSWVTQPLGTLGQERLDVGVSVSRLAAATASRGLPARVVEFRRPRRLCVGAGVPGYDWSTWRDDSLASGNAMGHQSAHA